MKLDIFEDKRAHFTNEIHITKRDARAIKLKLLKKQEEIKNITSVGGDKLDEMSVIGRDEIKDLFNLKIPYLIKDSFIPADDAQNILNEVIKLSEKSVMGKAGMNRGEQKWYNGNVRGDQIAWFSPELCKSYDLQSLRKYVSNTIQHLNELRKFLNEGDLDGKFSIQLAYYVRITLIPFGLCLSMYLSLNRSSLVMEKATRSILIHFMILLETITVHENLL